MTAAPAPSPTDELCEKLRAHFIAPNVSDYGQLFLTELTSPDGTRRADVVYVGLLPSRGFGVDVCEIKVSRSDFMREIKDPTKADAWWEYSSRYWIVAPDSTVAPPDRLPPGWGLMVPFAAKNRRRFQVLVEPAVREPIVDLSLVARLVARVHGDELARGQAELAAAREKYVADLRYMREHYEGDRTDDAKTRSKLLAEFEAAAGIEIGSNGWRDQITPEQAARAYRRLANTEQEMDRDLRRISSALTALSSALARVESLTASAQQSISKTLPDRNG